MTHTLIAGDRRKHIGGVPVTTSGSSAGSAADEHPPRSPLPRKQHALQVPDALLRRYNARVLDPSTAVQVAGQTPIRSTVYVADRLIVSSPEVRLRGALDQAAQSLGVRVVYEDDDVDDRRPVSKRIAREIEFDDDMFVAEAVQLVADSSGPVAPPDAWQVLQAYRVLVRDDERASRAGAVDQIVL
jgi:hypothetical protein